jgi:hypothetical protein
MKRFFALLSGCCAAMLAATSAYGRSSPPWPYQAYGHNPASDVEQLKRLGEVFLIEEAKRYRPGCGTPYKDYRANLSDNDKLAIALFLYLREAKIRQKGGGLPSKTPRAPGKRPFPVVSSHRPLRFIGSMELDNSDGSPTELLGEILETPAEEPFPQVGWYPKWEGYKEEDFTADDVEGLGTRIPPPIVAWLQQAAARRNRLACFHLGVLHEHGWGLPKSPQKAVAWYREAARDAKVPSQPGPFRPYGERMAMVNLGVMLLQGRGTPRSDEEALGWFRQAVACGEDPRGAFNLAGMLHEARGGLRRDPVAARAWLEKAAKQGHAPARKALARLARRGSVTQAPNGISDAWPRSCVIRPGRIPAGAQN